MPAEYARKRAEQRGRGLAQNKRRYSVDDAKLTKQQKEGLLTLILRPGWTADHAIAPQCLAALEKKGLVEVDKREGAEQVRLTPEGRTMTQGVADDLKAKIAALMDWPGYIALAYAYGRDRKKAQGDRFNQVDFFMGASVMFAWLNRMDKVPAAWVFLPLANKGILD